MRWLTWRISLDCRFARNPHWFSGMSSNAGVASMVNQRPCSFWRWAIRLMGRKRSNMHAFVSLGKRMALASCHIYIYVYRRVTPLSTFHYPRHFGTIKIGIWEVLAVFQLCSSVSWNSYVGCGDGVAQHASGGSEKSGPFLTPPVRNFSRSFVVMLSTSENTIKIAFFRV